MALLKTLERPMLYTKSPEMAALAEKWILRDAYQINCDVIQKQMNKKAFQEYSTQRAMKDKLKEYSAAIRECDEMLSSSVFSPTPKDLRIMRIFSFANAGEKDFGKDKDNTSWGTPTFILNSHREEALPGYREMADAIKEYKINHYGYTHNRQKSVNQLFQEVRQKVFYFMRMNFDINHGSEDIQARSNLFKDRKCYIKDPFINNLCSYGTMGFAAYANGTFGPDDSSFEPHFWNSVCAIMYELYTRDITDPEYKPLFGGYRIKIFDSDSSQTEPANEVSATKKDVNTTVPLKTITTEAIVLSGNRKCVYNEHHLKDLNIRVRVSTPAGTVEWHTLPAAFCPECKAYFVLEMDFDRLCQYGVPLCPVIDKETYLYNPSRIHQPQAFNTESRIHQLGYNVSQDYDYTDEQRHTILANIIENTDISIHEIKSNINNSINLHQKQPTHKLAVSKWKADLEFLSSYHIGDIPDVQADKFVYGRKSHK